MFVRPSNDPIMLDSIIFTNGKNLFFFNDKRDSNFQLSRKNWKT